MIDMRFGRALAAIGPVLLASLGLAAPPAAAQAPAPKTGGTVALTIDDLPVHSTLPPGLTRGDVARRLMAALKAAKAPPTYGFINAKGLKDEPDSADVLTVWREAGHPLANHAYSHMDLHTHTAEEFAQDVLANETTLQAAMGKEDWHWFRYPYLREGETLEKRRAVRAFLKEKGYRIAEVTLDFSDWAYNDPYARCVAKNDQAAIEWLKESYLAGAERTLMVGPEAARRIWGHDIPHILLLHVGGFETVMFPKLLELLDRRGFRLVTLPEAAGDPAYDVDPDQVSVGGASFLDLMVRSTKLDPVLKMETPFDKLDALCR